MFKNIACWNIRRGLIKREREIENLLTNETCDLLFLVETDTLLITEEKDYKLIGFTTLFQKKEKISDKTRIILLCKEN